MYQEDPYFFDYDMPEWNSDDRQYPGGYYGPPPAGGGIPPMGPPPAFSPPIPAWQYGPAGMRSCLYRNTYIWLRNGSSFWFFPTFVGRNAIVGFRWRRLGWIYHVINPNTVRSFQCF